MDRWNSMFGKSKPLVDGDSVFTIRRELNRIMTEKVGVFRTEDELTEAIKEISTLCERYRELRVAVKANPYNYALTEHMEVGYLLELSNIMTRAAIRRTESRGAHFRLDYPSRDDENWLSHTLVCKGDQGPVFEAGKVSINKYLPEERGY
jgi:succinate dehydrogenase / fumarate reductase flavoprotein subunit